MTHDEMIAAYAAPTRHYHNLRHIEDCLAALARVSGLTDRDRKTLFHAIWWHDVVYDATRPDNEELSAQLAEQAIAPDLREEVGRLIRLTKSHRVAPGDRLGAVMISIDLGILGADQPTYDAYAAAIRKEYAHVADQAYRNGRAAVLARFLGEPAIYPDPGFAARLERPARSNIARELQSLRS